MGCCSSVEYFPIPVIASADEHGKILVHRNGQPPQELQHHTNAVYSVCFHPANINVLASASEDKTVVVWDLRNGNKVKTMQYSAWANSVSFSSGGEFLAVGCNDSNTYVYNAAAGYEQVCVLYRGTGIIFLVAFHPSDPSLCLTACIDKKLYVWRVGPQPECLKVLEGHTDFVNSGVNSACWLPDGKHVVFGLGDNMVRLWNVGTGKEVAKLEGHGWYVYSVAASPDGSMIASGSLDNTCRIWDAKSGKVLQVLNHPRIVRAVTFSGNGHVVTGCDDNMTRVWTVGDGKVVAELGGHAGWVYSVAVPPTMGAAPAASSAINNSPAQPTSKPAATALDQQKQQQTGGTADDDDEEEDSHNPLKPSGFPAWMQQLGDDVDDETKSVLKKEKITEKIFIGMSGEDLKELGLPLGQRRALLEEINRQQ